MAYPLRSSYAAPWTAAPAAPTAPLWGAPLTGGLAYPSWASYTAPAAAVAAAPTALPTWSSAAPTATLPAAYPYSTVSSTLGSAVPFGLPSAVGTSYTATSAWPPLSSAAASTPTPFALPPAQSYSLAGDAASFPANFSLPAFGAPTLAPATALASGLTLPPTTLSFPTAALPTAPAFGSASFGAPAFAAFEAFGAAALPPAASPWPFPAAPLGFPFPAAAPSAVPLAPAATPVAGDKKVIVVFGATGAQGGGLVRAILDDPAGPFRVRAVTRDVTSAKAQELQQLGAEVVAASLDDPASLVAALRGAYGAFLVTFFWDHLSAEKETAHAKALAEAAKEAGVQHVVWSTLEDTRIWIPLSDSRMPTLQEKYKVPHLDAKGEGDRFFRELGVPTTFLLTSFYWENLISFGCGPKRGADGKLLLALPLGDKKMPSIGAEDIGRCVYGIFHGGKDWVGRTVGVAGEHLSGEEMAAALAAALGESVLYYPMPHDVYRSLGFPGADDLGNMFQFFVDCDVSVCGARDVALSRKLNPALQTFAEWLAANKDRIPLE